MKRHRTTWLLAVVPLLPGAVGGCGSREAAAVNGPAVASSKGPSDSAVANAADHGGPPAETSISTAATQVETASKTSAAPRPDAKTRIVDKSFDDVKFEMPPDEPFRRELIGAAIESLAGQRIRIRGYILPTAQQRGIKQFVLVRDNQQCCFGPGAALYDCILVEMQPGRTAEFSIRPVAVEGTFKIEILPGEDDKPLAIYRLEGEAVR